MANKFPTSTISVSGKITISLGDPDKSQPIDIFLNPLNQSKSGVYCLRNKLNGRLYIGMARNLENRKNRHFRDLNKFEHVNPLLQKDFVDNEWHYTLAESLFEFEVIIYCYPSELTFWEKILIDNLHPYYNQKKKNTVNDELINE